MAQEKAPQDQQGRMSLDQARALADRWKCEREDHEREGEIQARFADVPAHQLLDMWEKFRNEHGRRLTKFEGEALACALDRVFGFLPGLVIGEEKSAPLPPDDTMLSIGEVVRLTGWRARPRTPNALCEVARYSVRVDEVVWLDVSITIYLRRLGTLQIPRSPNCKIEEIDLARGAWPQSPFCAAGS